MRRSVLLLALAFCLGSTSLAGAEKATADSSSSSSKSKKKKKKKKRVAEFSGHGASKERLRTAPLEKPSGDVWLYVENLQEEVRVNIYKPDGSFDDASLAKLDELFRCVRSGEVRAVRPDLYEMLSRFYDHF